MTCVVWQFIDRLTVKQHNLNVRLADPYQKVCKFWIFIELVTLLSFETEISMKYFSVYHRNCQIRKTSAENEFPVVFLPSWQGVRNVHNFSIIRGRKTVDVVTVNHISRFLSGRLLPGHLAQFISGEKNESRLPPAAIRYL